MLLLAWLLVQTTGVQNWLVGRATGRLSKDLRTTVKIDHVEFKLFNRMSLEGTLVKDQNNDTLLYAGKLNVRITDWFFLKDNADLKYIGLEDASILLHRTTKTWNYQFILDYFGSPAPSSKKKKNINLSLKKIELRNINVLKKDEWRGEDQFFHIRALDLDARKIDLQNKKINISDIIIQDPLFSIYNYPGKRPPRRRTAASPAVPDTLPADVNEWEIMVEQLAISNGAFKTDTKQERAPYYYFDGQHILFSKINCSFKDLKLEADTLSAHINLSTTERSGFMVKAFSADVKWHPKVMSFTNLDIVTNKSHLRDAFHMRYEDFDDMGDFIEKINLEGNFINSEIESDDIAFFAPELSGWKKRIFLTGKAKGTISDLSAKDVLLQAGKNTLLKGDFKMTGLPDIDKTYIDFRANDFRTNYADAVTIVPELKKLSTPRLDKLQYLRFTGNFTGFVRDFVTYGKIQTNLGTIQSDVNMKLPENGQPSYSGTIATTGFDIGTFIDNDQLGKISFSGKTQGTGFRINDMKAVLDGNVQSIEYNGYQYSDIKVNGTLARRLFNGSFVAKDKELIATLNGLVDMSKAEPRFDFTANVEKANLQRLNLFKENIDINGQVDFRFTGSTIDAFLGSAHIHHASILKNGKHISFDSLSVVSTRDGNGKTILINSNEFDAMLEGEFSINELPNTFQTFLNRYYPSYVNPPVRQMKNERFSFTLHTRQVDDYIDLFDKRLSGFNGAAISGSIDSRAGEMALQAMLPQFSYSTLRFSNVNVQGKGSLDTLSIRTSIEDIIVNDSLHFPGTAISVQSAQDLSYIDINTSANKTLNTASITGQVQTLKNGVRILFSPSHFNINGKEWMIDKNGELIVSKELITAENLRLYNENQEVYVTTRSSTATDGNDVEITLKKINIGDFAPFFVRSNRLEGLLSGTVHIEDPFGKMAVAMEGEAEQFRLDNDSIGKITLSPGYASQTGKISLRAVSENPDYNFDINGMVNLNLPDSASEQIDITTNLRNTNIHLLEKYLGTIFSRMEGKATGQLRIKGKGNQLKYLGDIQLKDGGLLVDYTRCYYKIPEANIRFRDGYIDFGSFVVRDTLNNKGEVTAGRLYHNNFRDLSFDFGMRTSKLLMLNTGPSDNNQFYGTMIGKGSLSFTGPLRKMQLTIKGEPADSSTLFLPIGNSRENGDADFIVWKVYGKEMQQRFFNGDESNLNVSLDINANRYANVSVILDDLTGDVIQARGNGNLHIEVGTEDEMTMEGRYEIEEGEYQFSFQSIGRRFRLRPGEGNYISWNGDPDRATINIVAEYEAQNVRFKDLGISDDRTATVVISNKEVINYRGPVIVVATLKDRLSAPAINFQIELPPTSPLRNDQEALSLLRLIQRDENELTKQVSFLIVFNTFGPISSTRGPGNNIANAAFEGIVVNSISGYLSKALTNEFSSVLRALFKDEGLKVNINASLYNGVNLLDNLTTTTTNTQILLPDRTNFNLSLSKSYFNERLTFVFGSALDFGLNTVQQSQSSFQFLPDVTAQWKLTREGKFLLSFFYRDSYSYISGRARNRSGTSISYRKEFDRIGELFKKKKEE